MAHYLSLFDTLIFFFSQFLNDNFDYDELTALEQLSAYGLKNLMFDIAKVNILVVDMQV